MLDKVRPGQTHLINVFVAHKGTDMKTTVRLAPFLLAFALPALLVGCKSKPVKAERRSAFGTNAGHSIFIGLWQGSNKNGDIYFFKFTNTDWESQIDRNGVIQPYYKGTYTHEGTFLNLRITHEVNLRTMDWKPETGNLPQNISGRIEGNVLKVSVLTDAELVKKQ